METLLPIIEKKTRPVAVTKASLMQLRSMRSVIESKIIKLHDDEHIRGDIEVLSRLDNASKELRQMFHEFGNKKLVRLVNKHWAINKRIHLLELDAIQRRAEQLALALCA